MNWLTIAWSACGGVSATLALIHLILWWKDPRAHEYALAVVMALGGTGAAFSELAMLHTTSASEHLRLQQFEVLSVYMILVALTWFIYVRLGTARGWLAGLITFLWTVCLVLNFASPGSLVFLRMDSVARHVTSWGEEFSVGLGQQNPWNQLANFSVILILVYTLDAALRSRRQGNVARAGVIGGSVIVFLVFGGAHSVLVDSGLVNTPYMVAFAFLAIIAALSYELVSNAVQVKDYAQKHSEDEQRWQTLLAKIKLAVVETDESGKLVFVNPFLERISQYSAAELLGRPFSESVARPEQGASESEARNLLEAQPSGRSLRTLVTAMGERRRLLWSTFRIESGDDSPAGYFGLGEDITEFLSIQTELKQNRSELERLSRVDILGQLAITLAHELNQPLTAILSNAQAARRFMQQDCPDLDEVREILDDIVRDDKRAGNVIRSLGDMLRKGPIKREPISVAEVIGEVLNLLKAEIDSEKVLLEFRPDSNLPMVMAERVEIQQVILNLVVNAIHAMRGVPAGRKHLTVNTRLGSGEIVTDVKDNGRGIPKDDLPRVFETFFSRRSDGFGVGLAICQRIVLAHGGKISARNTTGGGAEFSFSLPLSGA